MTRVVIFTSTNFWIYFVLEKMGGGHWISIACGLLPHFPSMETRSSWRDQLEELEKVAEEALLVRGWDFVMTFIVALVEWKKRREWHSLWGDDGRNPDNQLFPVDLVNIPIIFSIFTCCLKLMQDFNQTYWIIKGIWILMCMPGNNLLLCQPIHCDFHSGA